MTSNASDLFPDRFNFRLDPSLIRAGLDLQGHDLQGHDLQGHDLQGHDLQGHDLQGHDLHDHRWSRRRSGTGVLESPAIAQQQEQLAWIIHER
jgi:uncharacterized protein YjbI with pentapeptide repeats